ncbi:hypothetical protein [cf. Phormidesmis sp. LEGE 11477]|uniref:hypothetical protein n=1 Tax=cf. Phormidesmis sp. LEGE 11477 TaxID=1828680 RepID=UPI001882FC8E|nr:hypothetical protein [cf. Phormidesmis sp. LEGE 11477]MBE9061997.1 hypothetical protein [cf. Phormidesmis sp. LEGE 11477]
MRNQNVRHLLLVLAVTAPLTGCQYLSAGEDIEIIDPIAATQERVAEAGQGVASALDGTADNEAFEDPTIDAPPIVTADLIQSTDPSARAQKVSRSRTDPFATLPIPLAPELAELPERTRASANNTGRNNAGSSNANNSSGSSAPSSPTPPAVRVQEEPLVEPSPVVELPSIPQPVVAPTVAVSGVIQLGGTPYAIVRAGNEPERYVRVGDRIGNGSVRVKRIDTLAYEPKVIFEENGIEVARPVSSAETAADAAPAEDADEPVAAFPASSSSSVAALPTPAVSVPTGSAGRASTFLPRMPLPPAPGANLLQPARGYIPNSLILLPPT